MPLKPVNAATKNLGPGHEGKRLRMGRAEFTASLVM
jgi:hypothetical protein